MRGRTSLCFAELAQRLEHRSKRIRRCCRTAAREATLLASHPQRAIFGYAPIPPDGARGRHKTLRRSGPVFTALVKCSCAASRTPRRRYSFATCRCASAVGATASSRAAQTAAHDHSTPVVRRKRRGALRRAGAIGRLLGRRELWSMQTTTDAQHNNCEHHSGQMFTRFPTVPSSKPLIHCRRG